MFSRVVLTALMLCLALPALAQKATGSLGVTITPQAANTAGAKWRVDGGKWKSSGATVSGLSAGNHEISYKKINGWKKPKNKTVAINANQTTNATGKYKEQSTPPSASFSADTTFGDPSLTVQFTDTSVAGSDPITAWTWDFGDGATSSEQNPQHIYTESGRFSVKLTVSNSAGANSFTADDYVLVYTPSSTFTPGQKTSETSATIGLNGGILSGPAGSALEGISVTFVPGTLPTDTLVTLSSDSGTLVPLAGNPGQAALVVETGDTAPQEEIRITLPSPNQQDEIVLLFHVDEDNKLSPLTLVGLDSSAHTATFSTYRTGTFVWIVIVAAKSQKGIFDFDVDTPFLPDKDGFSETNTGTLPFTIGGDCYGMAGFAKWYFDTHGGHWAGKYTNYTPALFEQDTGPLTYQRIVATRAQQSLSLSAKKVIKNNSSTLTNIFYGTKFLTLVYGMQNTGKPMLLILQGNDAQGKGIAHAVLAYGVHGNTIQVYDPNYPFDVSRHITLGLTGFDPYDSGGERYTEIWPVDLSIPSWREPFEYILYDATHDFSGRAYTCVTITSPNTNAPILGSLQNPVTTLEGRISTNGIAVVTEIRANVENEKLGVLPQVSAPVDRSINRNFVLPDLALGPGKNTLILRTFTRHDPAPPDQLADPELESLEVTNNYFTTAESDSLVLNVPLHLRVSASSMNLTSSAPSSQITVDSQEGVANSEFPLRWFVSNISDNRIQVTPGQTNGNVTSVTISATSTSQSFDATVTFTNLDNPSDKQVVSVNVMNLLAPHLKLSTNFAGLNSQNSHRTISVQTAESSPQGTLRWRAVPTDARITVSPASATSNMTQVQIGATDLGPNYSAQVRFENLDRPGEVSVLRVVVNNPEPTEDEIRGIWRLGTGVYDFSQDIDEDVVHDLQFQPCHVWTENKRKIAVTDGHLYFMTQVSNHSSDCQAIAPEGICAGDQWITDTWESTAFQRDLNGSLNGISAHRVETTEVTCPCNGCDTPFEWDVQFTR